MAGIVEGNDDAQQYAMQNRKATSEQQATVARLAAAQSAVKDASAEVNRLLEVNKRNYPKPTVKKHVSTRVQHALGILRGDIEI